MHTTQLEAGRYTLDTTGRGHQAGEEVYVQIQPLRIITNQKIVGGITRCQSHITILIIMGSPGIFFQEARWVAKLLCRLPCS